MTDATINDTDSEGVDISGRQKERQVDNQLSRRRSRHENRVLPYPNYFHTILESEPSFASIDHVDREHVVADHSLWQVTRVLTYSSCITTYLWRISTL